MAEVKSYKVLSLPSNPTPDSIYWVKGSSTSDVEGFITDRQGVPYPLKDISGSGGITDITNADGNLVIIGASNKVINITPALLSIINSALQSGDNISELTNDSGYVTSVSLPTKTSELINDGENGNPFVDTNDIGAVAFSNDYNDLDNLPTIPSGLGDLAYLNEVDTDEIVNHAVTNTKLAQMSANTVKGRLSGNGAPQDVSMSSLPISTATQTALNEKLSNDISTYTPSTTPLVGTEKALIHDGTDFKEVSVSEFGNSGEFVLQTTISEIRLLSGTLETNNFYTTDLGQQGNWYYDSSDTTSLDNTGTILVTSDGKRIKRIYDGIVNVKWFGTKGDGVTDDTINIQSVMNSSFGNVYFPNGTYLVDYVNVYSDTIVNTANNVLFKQKPQALAGKRIMNILGSNVVIGNVNFEGNITTDIDEQNHAVFIISNATNGNLSNIRIGDVSVSDIRGDGLYVGSTAGYRSSAISIGNVVVDNVYRNGVSITSGYDITIKTVTGNRVGFMIVDLETNAGQGTIEDVKISYVRGRCLGFIGTTATDYVDSVLVENADLDPSYQGQSTPSYAVGVALKDGITLRNCKSVNLGTAKVSGFDRCGIYTVTGVGEIGIQNLNIDFLGITNCSLTDAVLNSYMELSNSNVNINNLDINLNNAKRGIQSLASGIFGYIKATAIAGSSTIRSCSNLRIEYFNQTGAGIPINSCQKITVNGGTIVGDRLASSSNFCIFNNVTATATSFLFTSATGENHLINNSTLNTDYYAFGTSFRNYTMPNRFGIIRQWFDSNGYARTKNSAPTSDTDGAFKVANGVNANDAVNKGQLDLKQDILTNPVTGTGTTNRISKFTASGVIGNSQIFDNGTSVGVGTITPSVSSIVDINSTTKGFLPPRMTNAQRLAIASPAVGLIVYCTDVVEGLYLNKSTGWTFII